MNNINKIVKENNDIIMMMAEMARHTVDYGDGINKVRECAKSAIMDPEKATEEDLVRQQKSIKDLISTYAEVAIKYTDGIDKVKSFNR